MSRESYFRRVSIQTPTRMWINNPTDSEARLAIEHGAIHCTTNPTHTGKMLKSDEMRETALGWLKEALSQTGDASEASTIAQRMAVKRLMDIFLPLHEQTGGRNGFVSIQIDPHREGDPDAIIREALADRQLGPNAIAKIPVTVSGLAAIKELVRRDVPIIATEIMSVSQMEAACAAYAEASRASGCEPALFVTCIAGIFDDCLRMQREAGKIDVNPDALFQAGTLLTRRQYRLMREKRLPGVLLGGGARGLHHFTEFVGGDAHITINWKGTAETLIRDDPPVVWRMDNPAPESVLDELLVQVPDFRRAYSADGLAPDEFEDFPPVALFRSQFITGWNGLLEQINKLKEG